MLEAGKTQRITIPRPKSGEEAGIIFAPDKFMGATFALHIRNERRSGRVQFMTHEWGNSIQTLHIGRDGQETVLPVRATTSYENARHRFGVVRHGEKVRFCDGPNEVETEMTLVTSDRREITFDISSSHNLDVIQDSDNTGERWHAVAYGTTGMAPRIVPYF